MGLRDFQTKSTDTPEDRFYSHLKTKSDRTQDIYTKHIEELCKSPHCARAAHSFRKTYVTRMLNSGISEIAINMLVGKTAPETWSLMR